MAETPKYSVSKKQNEIEIRQYSCYIQADATYDLTNLATIKDWPVLITVVDLLWGTFLSVLVSSVGFVFGKRFS